MSTPKNRRSREVTEIERALRKVGLFDGSQISSHKNVQGVEFRLVKIGAAVLDLQTLNRLSLELRTSALQVQSQDGCLVIMSLKEPPTPTWHPASSVGQKDLFQVLVDGFVIGICDREQLYVALCNHPGTYCAYEIKGGSSRYASTLALYSRKI